MITPSKANSEMTENDMNKFQNDSQALELQNKAFEASKLEAIASDDFIGGAITEEFYIKAMKATELAVQEAIKFGVSQKDLPAV